MAYLENFIRCRTIATKSYLLSVCFMKLKGMSFKMKGDKSLCSEWYVCGCLCHREICFLKLQMGSGARKGKSEKINPLKPHKNLEEFPKLSENALEILGRNIREKYHSWMGFFFFFLSGHLCKVTIF